MKLINIERVFANKYNHLLTMVVLFLIVAPFIEHGERVRGQQVITILLLATIIICLRATIINKKIFWFCLIIVVLSFLLDSFSSRFITKTIQQPIHIICTATTCLFLGITIVTLMKNMFGTNRVSFDIIVGGVCIYFLIGILWALLYIITIGFNEAAIYSSEPLFLFYFSFTTLTTLGYGDIIPVSEFAKTLTNIEAIAGQMYLAVFVARLVGLHIVHELKQDRAA